MVLLNYSSLIIKSGLVKDKRDYFKGVSMSLSEEIKQLERVRATWEWTFRNALIRIQEINADIKNLQKAAKVEKAIKHYRNT